MCEDCVKEEYPDRGRMCLDTGSYLLNFRKCNFCDHKEEMQVMNKQQNGQDSEEEFITFEHVCSHCNHVIASHEYCFRVDGDFQEYEMDCMLCGRGEDVVTILPDDMHVEQEL